MPNFVRPCSKHTLRTFQTFGDVFQSDGRPMGQHSVQTVNCDQVNGVCNVTVPAPGFALIFLTNQALSESDPYPTMTFPTTAYTKTVNTLTIDPSVLATSNGERGMDDWLAGTSKGRVPMSAGISIMQAVPSFGALAIGILLVARLGRL